MSAAIFGGVGSIVSGFIGADSARKNTAAVLKAQQQAAFGAQKTFKTLIEFGVIALTGFAVAYAIAKLVEK